VQNTPLVGDKGKDLIIYLKDKKIFVECKHHLNGTIGRPTIQKLHSALITEDADRGIVVTSGTFSDGAIVYAQKVTPHIELFDKNILNDYATRAGYKLITSFEKGQVYTFPISDETVLKNNLSKRIEQMVISKPKKIKDGIKIDKRKVSLKPIYLVSYQISAVFSTSVGVIHSENAQGRIFLNGIDGKLLDENITIHFENCPINNFSSDDIKNIEVIPFKLLSGKMKESVTNHIINMYTTSVRYTGRNNVTYTKECVPKNKDIFLSDSLQVYMADNDVHFDLIGKRRFFKIADNGTQDFYVYKENSI
jgi:restriction system protein